MNTDMKLGVVLLAAGRSERFGENKLLADFHGRPMICCALETVRLLCAQRTAMVTGSSALAQLAQMYGCDVVDNQAPELGQSHSIRLGVSEMLDMDAVLLMVCDQPLLTSASLMRLLDSFVSGGKGIACLRDQNHMGNPAVFASQYYPQLLALEGDRGAKGVLRAHADDLLAVHTIGKDELADADTPQALDQLRSALRI